jgi:hypothetical protein
MQDGNVSREFNAVLTSLSGGRASGYLSSASAATFVRSQGMKKWHQEWQRENGTRLDVSAKPWHSRACPAIFGWTAAQMPGFAISGGGICLCKLDWIN